MGFIDIFYCVVFILTIGFMVFILWTIIPQAYGDLKSYQIMVDECEMNPDICFCDRGSCSIKSSCGYTRINDEPTTGGCNHTKICDIVRKANWKEGIWEYAC